MDDLQIQTHIAQSEANGKFQRMQQIKRQREVLKVEQDKLQEQLIQHIEKNGKVLAYKDDVPHILSVGLRTTTKFDKATLASELGEPQKDLTTVRLAQLVEDGTLTAQQIQDLMYTERDTVLKVRKASKNDMSLILGK